MGYVACLFTCVLWYILELYKDTAGVLVGATSKSGFAREKG
jgi:hypothetical protein